MSCQPALSTAGMDHWTCSQPERAEQQIPRVSMIEFLSLHLNLCLCTATLKEVGCVEPIDAHVSSAPYISMPGTTLLEVEQLKQV